MKLEKAIYQRSYLYYLLFLGLVLAGFWFTYLNRLLEQENYRMHLHGVALFVWCFLLISQAYLIRAKKYALHHRMGTFSYVWVPFMVWTTLDLLHYKLQDHALGTMDYFFVALVVNALVVFLLLYGLAIYYRKQPLLHARFMVCSIFPMITPATDRIVHIYFKPIVPYLYTIEGNPIAPVVGFALGDLLLILLCLWDWRSHRKFFVFPVALVLLIIYHYSVLNFHQFDFWRSFCEWFAR